MKTRSTVMALMLGCPLTAAAQSSVTLYGVADVNVEYVNRVGAVPVATNGFNPGPGDKVFRMASGGLSGSRWGLRGAEDLGAGWQASFVLESGFSLDNGTMQQSGRLFGRQAFVAL